MTKKIISLILVFVLSVSVVVTAFAANVGTLIKLEDKSTSHSFYSTCRKVYNASTNKSVSFSYSVPDNGAAVMLFYSTDCGQSQSVFAELNSLKWALSSKINFIAIESHNASSSAVASFMKKYNSSGFVDKSYYDTDDIDLLMWYYTYIKNNGSINDSIGISNLSFCYAVFVTKENSKNYLRYSLQAVNSASQIAAGLSKIMDTSSLATGYDGYIDSGIASVGKLSKPGIAQLLANNPTIAPANDSDYFDVAPSVSGTYKTGTVKTKYLQAATDRLSALRNIAGLPSVTMNSNLNSQAQYGAVLLAASNFDHKASQPSDMSDSFYEKGYAATTSSNLAGGVHLTTTPDGYMDDSDSDNISKLGHRRWQLNPYMAKVGFGFAINESNAYNSFKYYSTEKCMDTSGNEQDYRFIGWPASGNFPAQVFGGDMAWSVTLNPAYYQTPSKSNVKVTVTRTSDSKKWTFSKSESYTAASSGKYFNVETNAYGIGNCIIFRPNGITSYDGEYTVVISGLKESFGNSVSLKYKVCFFNADNYKNVSDGWYTENGRKFYIKNGSVVTGKLLTIGGKKYYFGKDGAMYTKKLISVSGNKYYMGSDGAAYTKRLISYNGYKYYLGKDGVAYKSKLISVDGKKYYIGSDCKAYKSKFGTIDGKKYYFGSDSVMVKSKLISVDGKKYYMGSDGAAYKSKLISVSGNKYYIGSDYIAYKSKFASLSGKKYYFGSDCVMYKSKTFSVSGVKWRADSYGVCTKV